MKQARQFIVHEHIMVDGKVISSPSYLVTIKQDLKIVFSNNSKFADEEHPERAVVSEAKLLKKESMPQAKSVDEENKEFLEETIAEEAKEDTTKVEEKEIAEEVTEDMPEGEAKEEVEEAIEEEIEKEEQADLQDMEKELEEVEESSEDKK